MFYGNEKAVGEGIRASGVPRDQIFVTTKLWDDVRGEAATVADAKQSLKRLGLDYVDLYLIHSPHDGQIVDTYKAMHKLKAAGLVKSVGVSNFGVRHLEGLKAAGCPPPSCNQIELHVFLQQPEIVAYCRAAGIAVTAYSPLGKGAWVHRKAVIEVAAKYGKTAAQLLIRWSLQSNFVCIPKSSNAGRIAENFDVFDFEISAEDMGALAALDGAEHCTWDPTTTEWVG